MKQKYIVELIADSIHKVSHMTIYRKNNLVKLLDQLSSIFMTVNFSKNSKNLFTLLLLKHSREL